jgi:hypothetical protein
MQFSLSQFPAEHQTYVRKCDDAKSLRALMAALKVKTKKAHLLYFEKCLNHILRCFFNFFIPHSAECMSKTEKRHGKEKCGQTGGHYRN